MSASTPVVNGQLSPPPMALPPIDEPAHGESLDFDSEVLDYKIRRASTFGGLGVAGALYVIGVLVILKLMTIWPFNCMPSMEITDAVAQIVECPDPMVLGEGWHGVAGVMLALFSVPTVLLIAILRMSSSKRSPLPDSLYTTVADKLTAALERALDARR